MYVYIYIERERERRGGGTKSEIVPVTYKHRQMTVCCDTSHNNGDVLCTTTFRSNFQMNVAVASFFGNEGTAPHSKKKKNS